MILITGAAGKTGRAVLKALVEKGESVRVLVHRREQAGELVKLGAADSYTGDMTKPESFLRAMEGVTSVYHICPNMHEDEIEIGNLALKAARSRGIEHFVYHSVLHPHTEKMAHHWKKMRVEELLFESGLRFTVLQPAPYMQNILAARDEILTEGRFPVPYPVESKISLIDLVDLGKAAAVVLTEPGYKDAVYELTATRALTQTEVAALLSKVVEQPVVAEEIPVAKWRTQAEKAGLGGYQVETLLQMFIYYAQYGLSGNNYLLKQILGREPHSLTAFIAREFSRH